MLNWFLKIIHPFFILFLGMLIVACESTGTSRGNLNTQISISYATVVSVETVKLKSEAGKAAAIGGLWGLAAGSSGNRKDMMGGAALGALLMGGTAKIAEGSNTAYAYILREKNKPDYKIMTEQRGIQVDDCVAVETGKHTNLRRISHVYCQPASNKEHIETSLHKEIQEDASECQDAKQELLNAKAAEIDAWIRKVKALCDD
jgi:hypothetical protein